MLSSRGLVVLLAIAVTVNGMFMDPYSGPFVAIPRVVMVASESVLNCFFGFHSVCFYDCSA